MNSTVDVPRKAGKTSVLKTQSEERQEQILEYYETHKGTDTAKWLATLGIETTALSVSKWRKWYLKKQKYEERETRIIELLIRFKRRDPSVTNESLTEMGQFIFNALAIEEEDVKTWSLAQGVQLRREKGNLDREKFEFDIRKHTEKAIAAETKKSRLSPAEKQARIRQILGTE